MVKKIAHFLNMPVTEIDPRLVDLLGIPDISTDLATVASEEPTRA
jgi:hypothetical protein